MPEKTVTMQKGSETAEVVLPRVPVFIQAGWKIIPSPALKIGSVSDEMPVQAPKARASHRKGEKS
ncbi:MAG: hypothetical protein IMZ62_06475 [Chloroflexi bacterium]|nr:hypothetical protein [Chloroflexota bacterium]